MCSTRQARPILGRKPSPSTVRRCSLAKRPLSLLLVSPAAPARTLICQPISTARPHLPQVPQRRLLNSQAPVLTNCSTSTSTSTPRRTQLSLSLPVRALRVLPSSVPPRETAFLSRDQQATWMVLATG